MYIDELFCRRRGPLRSSKASGAGRSPNVRRGAGERDEVRDSPNTPGSRIRRRRTTLLGGNGGEQRQIDTPNQGWIILVSFQYDSQHIERMSQLLSKLITSNLSSVIRNGDPVETYAGKQQWNKRLLRSNIYMRSKSNLFRLRQLFFCSCRR